MPKTYNDEYSIEWLNFNPDQNRIEVKYSKKITLDTGEKATINKPNVVREGLEYETFFGTPIKYQNQDLTLGDLITSMVQAEIVKDNPDVEL